MLIRCVVDKLDTTKGGMISIKLSINPQQVNKALSSTGLKSGMVRQLKTVVTSWSAVFCSLTVILLAQWPRYFCDTIGVEWVCRQCGGTRVHH